MTPAHSLVATLGLLLATGPAATATATATATGPPAPSPSPASAVAPSLPGQIPETFRPVTDRWDHQRREVMIPMRDGVKLHTVILVPRGARGAPMLLTRTPYDADALTRHAPSAHLDVLLQGYDNATDVVVEGGYIRVVQDVRGKHHSEGDYVMNRPVRGPLNPTRVDHATDTWDTIDWLVKNVPESNGRVGLLGISYDGFLPLMALFEPHPALQAVVPMNPMVDGWLGDDWFHHGAFRQQMLPYILEQEASRDSSIKWWRDHHDDYDAWLRAGSAGEMGKSRGLEQVGFWRELLAHPAYDAWWRGQAVDRLLAERPLTVPVLLVHGLFDQEDIYGALAVYRALAPRDPDHDKLFLAIGPWYHGQQIDDGSALGPIRFGSDTSLTFRREVLRPFLDRYLKDRPPPVELAPVTAFETGTNAWRRYQAWPPAGAAARAPVPVPLYLRAGLQAGFEPPRAGDAAFEEYLSDPAKPVPYRARPIPGIEYDDANGWRRWLVDDQREASSRTDVLAFVSPVLAAPVRISGAPIADLVASTSGTDSDWVVKLIDVYPDEVAAQPELGGYQLMIAADIFRGRYRESPEQPRPLAAGKPLRYRFPLPAAHHVFLPGHRIMVQVQSSWFPLYDRNPQAFVPSIFWARPGDFRKATQRVYHAPGQASLVELPVVRE